MYSRAIIAILISLTLWSESQAQAAKLLDARNCKVAFGWKRPTIYSAALVDQETKTITDANVQHCANEHNGHTPAILNIDQWEMPRDREKLLAVINLWRETTPHKMVSVFSSLPQRNYTAPIAAHNNQADGPKLMQQWADSNALMRAVSYRIQYIFPSLYTYDTSEDHSLWDVCAKANIEEAKKYDKPVFPFICPRIFTDEKNTESKPMDKEFFEHQLSWCFDNCDGVVVWDYVAEKPNEDSVSIMTTKVMKEFALSRLSGK